MRVCMPLSRGVRLGPYEIEERIGAGGMGEVYRAYDQRLERMVAVKVLAIDWAGDHEFRARFRREARALSKLSHPNVCAVYDVGAENGTDYFVMELLEGETLAARLQRGALEEAIDVARQTATALATSHRVGVVHRDLKPANIFLTSSGVKLLDFGLARIAQAAALPSAHTVTDALTQRGMVLGMFQYMSPEQVNGEEADARTDLFSLGVILYEMVTGRRAFAGDSQATLTASILKDDPPAIRAVRPEAPPELDALIRSCLVKKPDDRWQSAHDLHCELGWLAERIQQPRDHLPRTGLRVSLWIAAALVIVFVGLAALFFARQFSTGADIRPAVRSEISAPPDTQFVSVGTYAGPAMLSPDGRRVAFLATSIDGRPRLWIRDLGSGARQAVAGTEGAYYPFWSADSEQLGFFADRKLKKVHLGNGAVTSLCFVTHGAGGTWNRDGTIVFAGLNGVLQRVSASGGAPRAATSLSNAQHDRSHRWPVFLPGGRRFLYAAGQANKPGQWSIRLGSLDSDQVVDIVQAQSNAGYANGALLFVRNGTLVAQPVDERTLQTRGDAVSLAEHVLHDPVVGRAVFSASDNGSLLYQTGSAITGSRLVWRDRHGNETGVVDDACYCNWPRLSPDGQRAAVSVTDARTGNIDLWIYELAEKRRSHLTFEPASELQPAWTPDGNQVVFTSTRTGVRDIHWVDSRGAGSQEPLHTTDRDKTVQSVSGAGIVFVQDFQLWLLPLAGERTPRRLLSGEPRFLFGSVSPDGRWFVYQSNENSGINVYVTSYPALSGRWLVSENGGILPKWSARGQEIIYLSLDHSEVFAAAVSAQGQTLRVSSVQLLFRAPMVAGIGYPYDVTPDGQHFMTVVSPGTTTTPLTLVTDWPSELEPSKSTHTAGSREPGRR
jgi:hypothetical protein